MKLLPKSEITRLKAVESKAAIDEGLKLARKVDNLREVVAAEEQSLETFRRETVAKINEQTKEASQERDKVKGELRVAQEELAEAKKPLDEEWLKVADIKASLDRRGETLNEREALLSNAERALEFDQKRVIGIIARAETREQLAGTKLQDAESASKAAKTALETAQRVESKAREIAEKTHRELTHRDLLATGRERDVTLREADIKTREEALVKGWELLKDREAMFERTLKRNN